MSVQQPLVITINEARKHLGKDAEGLSDPEIEELIFDLTRLAKKFLLTPEVPNNKQVLQPKTNTGNI